LEKVIAVLKLRNIFEKINDILTECLIIFHFDFIANYEILNIFENNKKLELEVF
jgi:hypothetical protein